MLRNKVSGTLELAKCSGIESTLLHIGMRMELKAGQFVAKQFKRCFYSIYPSPDFGNLGNYPFSVTAEDEISSLARIK